MNSFWSKNKAKLGQTFIKAIKVILLKVKANSIYSVSPDKLIHRRISYWKKYAYINRKSQADSLNLPALLFFSNVESLRLFYSSRSYYIRQKSSKMLTRKHTQSYFTFMLKNKSKYLATDMCQAFFKAVNPKGPANFCNYMQYPQMKNSWQAVSSCI